MPLRRRANARIEAAHNDQKEAQEAIEKSQRDREEIDVLAGIVRMGLRRLAELNQENNFAEKMRLAYGPKGQ